MDVAQRLEGLEERVREDFGDKLVALRREVHREPEIGFDTECTAGKVVEALTELPLETRTGVAQNGLVGLLRGGEAGAYCRPEGRHGRIADPRGDRVTVRLRRGR